MLEAIMIVTMMSGQVVQTKVPNFTECLKNVSVVELQKSVKSVSYTHLTLPTTPYV